MGIGSSIASKVGIPLAIAVGAGLLLAKFREPIIGAISSGSSVIGQSLSQPFTSILKGFQKGFEGLPTNITIPFPVFDFTLGGEVKGKDNQNKDFDPLGNLCDNSLGIFCFGKDEPVDKGQDVIKDQPNAPNAVDIIKGAEASELTLFEGGSILVDIPRPVGSSLDNPAEKERLTREEIVTKFPNAVGVFDFLGTKETEFLPLSISEIALAGKSNFKLSGQIFNEIGSIDDV